VKTNGNSTLVCSSLINLTTDVTGTLPVSNGGTSATTLTGILQGNGTSPITGLTNTANYLSLWNGSSAPYLTISHLNVSGTNTIKGTDAVSATAGYITIADGGGAGGGYPGGTVTIAAGNTGAPYIGGIGAKITLLGGDYNNYGLHILFLERLNHENKL